MNSKSFKEFLRFAGQVSWFYVLACGITFNDWTNSRAMAEMLDPGSPTTAGSKPGAIKPPPPAAPSGAAINPYTSAPGPLGYNVMGKVDPKSQMPSVPVPVRAGELDPPISGTLSPGLVSQPPAVGHPSTGVVGGGPSTGVREDPGPARLPPPSTYYDRAGAGCLALARLEPKNCQGWSGFPKEPFNSCRSEALQNLKEARAALELAELYENRGKQTEQEIRAKLVDKLRSPTKKGGVEISQDEAIRLADQLVAQYKNSEQAYGRCRADAQDSAWKHNMVLAGVISREEMQKQNGATTRCDGYIAGAVGQSPSYDDSLTNSIQNDQPG